MSYQDCLRMRQSRKVAQSTSKSIAIKGYGDDIDNMLLCSIFRIMGLFKLKRTSTRVFIEVLLREGISNVEVVKRISNIYNIFEKYGYDDKISMLENNIGLLRYSVSDLNHVLAIANMYGLDETVLERPTISLRMNDNELYALTEELKSRGVEVSLESIQSLFNELYKEHHSKQSLYDLVHKYPLTNKTIFAASFMYNQYLKAKNKIVILK